jgi:hypothetical protein
MRRAIASTFATVVALVALVPPAGATDRPLSTDRPDRTESPYSVPKGWMQFEADVVSHGRIEGIDESVTGTSVCAFNAKYGVTPRLDLQLLFTPWLRVRSEQTGLPTTEDSGTGQVGLRAKFNVTGNDNGRSAMAVLPFAFVPTRGDAIIDNTTWGMVAPVAIGLGGDRAMSAMLGFTRVENDKTWLISSLALGSPIAGDLAGFIEMYVSRAGFETEALDDATVDVGLTFAPGPDWQLDAGLYRGLTDNTEDWRVFLGASARFSLSSR